MAGVAVTEIKGYQGLRAFNAFHTLMLGLKMLPAYLDQTYDDFFASFQDKTDEQKEKRIREAILFVRLEEDEIEALVSFAKDANGVTYSKANMKNLNPGQLHEIIAAVCMEMSRIRIDLLTDSEKKKSPNGQ